MKIAADSISGGEFDIVMVDVMGVSLRKSHNALPADKSIKGRYININIDIHTYIHIQIQI